jgi:hypothetical protein
MGIEKICLCSSRKFFDRLKDIKEELERLKYVVLLPSMDNIQDNFYLKGGRETEFAKIHYDLIRNHFKKIEQSDAILVCNFDKDEIAGYIGGSVLMEMTKAFDSNKPIFLTNPVPIMPYRAEILAMQPIVVSKLEEIKQYSK